MYGLQMTLLCLTTASSGQHRTHIIAWPRTDLSLASCVYSRIYWPASSGLQMFYISASNDTRKDGSRRLKNRPTADTCLYSATKLWSPETQQISTLWVITKRNSFCFGSNFVRFCRNLMKLGRDAATTVFDRIKRVTVDKWLQSTLVHSASSGTSNADQRE